MALTLCTHSLFRHDDFLGKKEEEKERNRIKKKNVLEKMFYVPVGRLPPREGMTTFHSPEGKLNNTLILNK